VKTGLLSSEVSNSVENKTQQYRLMTGGNN
jgi:hypothetical protein